MLLLNKIEKMKKNQFMLLAGLQTLSLVFLIIYSVKIFTRADDKIVLVQNGLIGVDTDNNNIADIKVEVTDAQFMMITSANLNYDLPVILNQKEKKEIVKIEFATYPISSISPDALKKHKETFFWKR